MLRMVLYITCVLRLTGRTFYFIELTLDFKYIKVLAAVQHKKRCLNASRALSLSFNQNASSMYLFWCTSRQPAAQCKDEDAVKTFTAVITMLTFLGKDNLFYLW